MQFIVRLLILIWLHLFGDYVLQTDFLATQKGKNDFILLVHSCLWAGIICAGLWLFGVLTWPKAGFLIAGHFFIDRWKARKSDKTHALGRDLWIDQTLHIVQLLVCLY